jgi:hypothetical protein
MPLLQVGVRRLLYFLFDAAQRSLFQGNLGYVNLRPQKNANLFSIQRRSDVRNHGLGVFSTDFRRFVSAHGLESSLRHCSVSDKSWLHL